MGKLQHLGFDGAGVTNGSDGRTGRSRLHPFPAFGKLWQLLPLTKGYDKYEAVQIQTFQIPFAGVRIRATYVENWRENTTAERRWEKAWQVAWLIHREHACSSHDSSVGKTVHRVIQSYVHSEGPKKGGIYMKMLTRDCRVESFPEALRHRVRFSWQSLAEYLRSGGFTKSGVISSRRRGAQDSPGSLLNTHKGSVTGVIEMCPSLRHPALFPPNTHCTTQAACWCTRATCAHLSLG